MFKENTKNRHVVDIPISYKVSNRMGMSTYIIRSR